MDLVEALLHFSFQCAFSKNKLPLKLDSPVPEDFSQIRLFPSFLQKITKISLVDVLKWKLMDFKEVNFAFLKNTDLHQAVTFHIHNYVDMLTHYSPVLLFYIPWKHQKTIRFSDVSRGYRKAKLACNGLIQSIISVNDLTVFLKQSVAFD